MARKVGTALILLLNAAGIVCLILFWRLYLLHNTTGPNFDVMLSGARWHTADFLLILGFFPMAAANLLAFQFVGRESLRLPVRLLFFLPAVLCLVLAVHYLAGAVQAGSVPAEPVVQIRLEHFEDHSTEDLMLCTDGRTEQLETPFTPDAAEVWTFDGGCFTATVQNGSVRNHLTRTEGTDGAGNTVPAEGILLDILQAAADQAAHAIWQLKVLRDGDTWFAAIQLNVNLHEPCDFYVYHTDSGRLELLCGWESADITGIALP